MCNVTTQSSEFKTIEKILIRVFDLSVTFAGGRKNGIKKYEHMVL